MPKLTDSRVPSYRLHKQSGQAIVTLNGADILLGRHNSAASKADYNRCISEWIAAGRQRLDTKSDLTISELIARYKIHCECYYRRPDGTLTSESDNIKQALRPLRRLYGATPAAEFSPLKLKSVREAMIDPALIDTKTAGKGWCRSLINRQCSKIRQMFRWASENELVSPTVYHGLLAVPGLKYGRCEARESDPVLPVSDLVVEHTLPYLSSIVSAMVQIQRLTGARPCEVCQMRSVDVDQAAAVWSYKLTMHKTAHHGRQRVIYIGPKAQVVLRPFLKPLNPTAYIFNPADAMAEVRERRNKTRKTPLSCGNRVGTNRVRKPIRQPSDQYDAASYRRSIARACDQAFPPPEKMDLNAKARWISDHRWAPNQLRHSAATEIRKRFGLEGAQVVLGHASANITQVYAERDLAAASRIAAEMG